jgi:hypothetical protein
MTSASKMRTSIALAVLAGGALRVFFVVKFPVTDSGDSAFYMELAWNWLKRGVFGSVANGRLAPTDMRVPGYPAFLAGIFAFSGESARAAMLAQVAVDMAACFVIALIAARLAPEAARRRVAMAGLWMAALCPFTANYTAAVLTETLTIFLTALAILVLLQTDLGAGADAIVAGAKRRSLLTSPWLLGGFVVGCGALVRPETPLLAIAAAIVLAMKWWRPADWGKLLRAGVLMGFGVILPLLPWAARNWRTLHEVQFLAPRYLAEPGDYVPLGFTEWTKTWMWRFRDVYLVPWKEGTDPIPIETLPESAFDSSAQRERVADLLERYNDSTTIDPAMDGEFLQIARERTARHPLRTYVTIPVLRSLAMWFTPRVELLPFTGHLEPLREKWEDDRRDLMVSLSLTSINAIYIALAVAGAWAMRKRPGLAFLLAFILMRTAFFTQNDTPEPRYMLECYPIVIALGAQMFGWGAVPQTAAE